MSDGSLSQDEIDALLAGAGDIDLGESAAGNQTAAAPNTVQALKEALEATVAQQQSNMEMVTSKTVSMSVVSAKAGAPSGISGEMVRIAYDFGDQGRHMYVLSAAHALHIAAASMGMEGVELDEASLQAIQEVFSQMSGPVINTLSDRTGSTIMPSPAEAVTVDSSELGLSGDIVTAQYTIDIEGDGNVTLYEIFESSFVARLGGQGAPAPMAAGAGMQGMQMPGMGQQQMGGMGMGGMQGMQGMGMQGMGMQGMGMQGMAGGMMGGMPPIGGSANVQSVQFPSLQPHGGGSEQGNIGLLMDVYMEMTVELGRTKKLIREILGMGEGTIIELDKLAGEPVDILVNHKLIAKGEVVVIDENFGVRVTEIVSPMERVNDMT